MEPPAKPPKSIRRAPWKESSVYQIYPASFCDSNNDGIGDIPGIISKLDYIRNLGVDYVWLSPVLQSPQVDMGYDISDYRQIHPPYGTMDDHDALIRGLHERGLKYVMDLVVNHTSDQHEWFKQSCLGKGNRYADWYMWRPGRRDPETGERMPPNNWESVFSGSAWEWHEGRQEYYLHIFAKEQPDLNWDNPDVIAAVHEMIRFWLDRGVDGFRLDVINFISKDPGLPDGDVQKPGFLQSGVSHFACGPKLHEHLQGIGSILREYDAFSVGEMPGVYDVREIAKAVGQDRGELAMAFHFEIVDLDGSPESKFINRAFKPTDLKRIVNKWQTFMRESDGWNALYIENHDQGRSISRYASDKPDLRAISSKMLATHLAFQSGTLFIYQGQELAMANVPDDWPLEAYKDVECVNHWKTVLRDYPDDKEFQEKTRAQYRLIARDNARTPMQWNAEEHAGFMPKGSKAEPWMGMHDDYKTWNAEEQIGDESSALSYWKKVLQTRKEWKDVFVYGEFEMIDMDNEDVISYLRSDDDGKVKALVVTSFSGEKCSWKVPKEAMALVTRGELVLSNYDEPPQVDQERDLIHLRVYETQVWLIKP